MNRLRPLAPPQEAGGEPFDAGSLPASSSLSGAKAVFRRFFDLIGRFEQPLHRDVARPAPEVKARITRLDDETHRGV